MVIRKLFVRSVIRNFVFLCRKVGSIKGYFCRYIIKQDISFFYIEQFKVLVNIKDIVSRYDLHCYGSCTFKCETFFSIYCFSLYFRDNV